MTAAALVLAGLACLAVAAAVDLVFGVTRRPVRALPYAAIAAGAGCMAAAGALAVLGSPGRVDLGTFLGFGRSTLALDALAGLFLTISCAVAFASALVMIGWVLVSARVRYRGLGAASALVVGGVAVILLADNAFLFLLAWESLTFAFYLLSGYQRHRPGAVQASFVTLSIGKLSGALLLVGFLLLAGTAGSFQIFAWSGVPVGSVHDAAYALLVAGFGAKVGLVPLQIWMPGGYSAAPGPARAIMAGAAVNVGFYGLWRTFEVLGAPPEWLAIVVMFVAAFTAILGIAHATVQADLNRVIAYSSIENGGLIVTAYGVALVGGAVHEPTLVALGLVAATLQVVTHALGKSALFCASATFEEVTGSTTLDSLRGLGRRLPWSGATFGIGAMTLAGLPPTVGFASEWFILEAFMQQFRVAPLDAKIAMAVAGALVALTAGFAAVAFVRVVGLAVLGSPSRRSEPVRRASEGGPAGKAGLALLAVGCLAVAVVSPAMLGFLSRGLSPLVAPGLSAHAVKSTWVLQPVYHDFSILSPTWLWVVLPVGLLAVIGAAGALSAGRLFRVRRVPAWRSATGGVTGDDRYTAFGYANPSRKILAGLLLTRSELKELEGPRGEASETGSRSAPRAATTHLGYSSDVVEIVETFLYRPILVPMRAVVTTAKRLQSGRLDAYIAYMLIALIGLIAAVAALA